MLCTPVNTPSFSYNNSIQQFNIYCQLTRNFVCFQITSTLLSRAEMRETEQKNDGQRMKTVKRNVNHHQIIGNSPHVYQTERAG